MFFDSFFFFSIARFVLLSESASFVMLADKCLGYMCMYVCLKDHLVFVCMSFLFICFLVVGASGACIKPKHSNSPKHKHLSIVCSVHYRMSFWQQLLIPLQISVCSISNMFFVRFFFFAIDLMMAIHLGYYFIMMFLKNCL